MFVRKKGKYEKNYYFVIDYSFYKFLHAYER